MLGYLGVESFCHIAFVFQLERVRIVFAMPQNENLPAIHGFDDVNTCFMGLGQQAQTIVSTDIFSAYLGVARVGRGKNVVKTTQKRFFGI